MMKYLLVVTITAVFFILSCTNTKPSRKLLCLDDNQLASDKSARPSRPPDSWGQYEVGTISLDIDGIKTRFWYPAQKKKFCRKIRYLFVVKGKSCKNLLIDSAEAPYPVIIFSPGNKSMSGQSFSSTSFWASHGFIVAALDHPGNTLFDSPSEKEMADIALRRPKDIAIVLRKIKQFNADKSHLFYQQLDVDNVGMAGHSFGGYTAMVAAGGIIDVEAAAQRSQKKSKANFFSRYFKYWKVGTVQREKELENIRCSLALTPGGFNAFGSDGLANIKIPVMIMVGSKEEWMKLNAEARPMYRALQSDAYKLEITGAGHMSFTDLGRLPFANIIPGLKKVCGKKNFIDLDRNFAITNTFAVAFFRKYLKNDTRMDLVLSDSYAALYSEILFEKKP